VRSPRVRIVAAAALCAAALTALAACSGDDDPSRPASAGTGTITVGSFDFAESEVLAALYATALARAGFRVDLQLGVGPREFVDPALARGLLDSVPEYAGTALAFLDPSTEAGGGAPPDADGTNRMLDAAADRLEATALAPAPAADANAFVVTRATATRHGLRDLSDLARVAQQFVFGGPPECPSRPLCLQGLRRVYGIEFGEFVALDVGGPATLQALRTGDIDAGLLFTTDPALASDEFVALRDDRGLQPPENITPLVRTDVVDRHGRRLVQAVDAVSRQLTTEELRALNARVTREPGAVERIAQEWLDEAGVA
jgi:osmoprotectant transport system substrate-binding protein